jgi:hypothetical protein
MCCACVVWSAHSQPKYVPGASYRYARVRGVERERECVCVCFFFVYVNARIWSPVLDGSCNLCFVFLLLWERNVSLHVHALMDSSSVNLLRYVELQKFGAVFSTLFWWFWDFVRCFQRWSFKIPYCCSDHRLIQCIMSVLITSLGSSCGKEWHVSCTLYRNTVTHGME